MKQDLINKVLSVLDSYKINYELGNTTDIKIDEEFLDAKWSIREKKIKFNCLAYFNEEDKTIYYYETTKEVSSGFSNDTGYEQSFQTGSTLFKKVKSVGIDFDGVAYEFELDLGSISKAFKDTARAAGWKYRGILSKNKALYPKVVDIPFAESRPVVREEQLKIDETFNIEEPLLTGQAFKIDEPIKDVKTTKRGRPAKKDKIIIKEEPIKKDIPVEKEIPLITHDFLDNELSLDDNDIREKGSKGLRSRSNYSIIWFILVVIAIIIAIVVNMSISRSESKASNTNTVKSEPIVKTPVKKEVGVKIDGAVFASAVDDTTFEPITQTKTFGTKDKINYVLKVASIPAGTKITYEWYYEYHENYEKPFISEQYDATTDIINKYFDISFTFDKETQSLPTGNYKVVVKGMQNDKETFKIVGECEVVEQ